MTTEREVLLKVVEYLESHNDPSALEGYFNDIAEEINPSLILLEISPITLVALDSFDADFS